MIKSNLTEKLNESLSAVLPIVLIVLVLSFSIAPVPSGTLLGFLFGAILVIVGMTLFSLGADLAMQPMGEKLGGGITKTKNLFLILSVGFILGFLITTSEPDLQVLATQVQSVPKPYLIFSVAFGVGLFLVAALLKVLLGISIKWLLLFFYAAIFVLSIFVPKDFLAVAFDSGGVTTGPMTVPFIMAFGVGISAIRSDKKSADDSFGLVALCSIGPILAVLVLSLIFGVNPGSSDYSGIYVANASHSVELSGLFLKAFPTYFKEIAVALLPIIAFFGIFQLFLLKLRKNMLIKICVGLAYTYLGLVLFLTGANVGFMPAGSYLGETIASMSAKWVLIPLGALFGFFIVRAEPAVYVLMQQVEELTDGAIAGKTLRNCLSVGICGAIGLAMFRVLTGIGIMWFLIPGYLISLILAFIVPEVFTSVAFDSGGVASGPMTATFLLPFAIGACTAVGGDVFSDAFGVVALVAMTPLLAVQILAVIYKIKANKPQQAEAPKQDDRNYYEIIEL